MKQSNLKKKLIYVLILFLASCNVTQEGSKNDSTESIEERNSTNSGLPTTVDSIQKVNEIKNTTSSAEQFIFNREDSLQILSLVRNLYKWQDSVRLGSFFNIGIKDSSQQYYSGINWSIHRNREKDLKTSGFFSNDFIANYKKTLELIDSKVKSGAYRYPWEVGMLPPFGSGGNEWCHCQDSPTDDYWKRIEINNIRINQNTVSLTWDWGSESSWSKDFDYPFEVIKVGDSWKIYSLDGFDSKHC